MARKKKENEDKELTLEEAQNVIRRLAHPKHVNQEDKLLREAAAVVLKETQPEFEFGDEEDEDVKIDSANAAEATSTELTKPPGFLEQLGAQVQALGPAGVIALSSAAYFQIDTVVEETRTVATVAEEKWEEVKFEHPNINWDDPLAGFTTIVGMGDIEIDLDPPNLPAKQEPKESNEPTTISQESDTDGEETKKTEVSDESVAATEESNDEDKNESEDDASKEDNELKEEKEEPKKKKKGFFSKLLGGDDEEEAEEAEEESEPEPEADEEVVEEEPEAEEESNEPEPEAEEQVEEKPKKKSGGLFSFLTGGDDDEADEPEDEQGEPTQDDQIPEEQADETEVEEPETEEVAETTTDNSDENSDGVGNSGYSNTSSKKKSSGGLFAALFGTDNTEEVEESEVSTDEEPTITVADSGNEEAPPLSVDEEVEIEVETIDEIDDIKPHSDVMVADTEVEVDALPEIDDVNVEIEVVDSGETFEINLSDMSDIDIEFLSESFENGDIEIADLSIDDIIEETVEEEVIEMVRTPIEGTSGTVIVSPAGSASDINFADIFGPSAPGYDMGDTDATPI